MIRPERLVRVLRRRGRTFFTGVPCSYLTPLINHVIRSDAVQYLPSANEGDAVATAAGSWLGGDDGVVLMQNSGLGNAVNPLTSLVNLFEIPLLLMVTLRGEPDGADAPQHRQMGRLTRPLLDRMEIPWALVPDTEETLMTLLDRARESMNRTRRPFALLVREGTFVSEARGEPPRRPNHRPEPASIETVETDRSGWPTRRRVLSRLVEESNPSDTVLIASTGYMGRTLYDIANRPNHFYMVGSMGCASSLGLGLSLARPEWRVGVVEGDGALLMRMGNMSTVGTCGGSNLRHLVLDNSCHESTGGQPTVTGDMRVPRVARGCGYGRIRSGWDDSSISALMSPYRKSRPTFSYIRIRSEFPDRLPRPDIPPPERCRQFMDHIGGRSTVA